MAARAKSLAGASDVTSKFCARTRFHQKLAKSLSSLIIFRQRISFHWLIMMVSLSNWKNNFWMLDIVEGIKDSLL